MANRRIPPRRLGGTEVSAAGITEDESLSSLIPFLRGNQAFCFFNPTPGVFSARQRGGVASLCGLSTYIPINPGPQKKFKVQTLSGNYCAFDYPPAAGGCAGLCAQQSQQFFSGSYSYNAATCAGTNNQASTYGDILFPIPPAPCNCASIVQAPYAQPAENFAPFTDGVVIPTATVVTKTWDYSAVPCYNNGGSSWRKLLNMAMATLSGEDTETDAIARLVAANPYPAFAACGSPVVCALARYEQRGNVGYSFVYQDAQARGDWTGLPPSRAICVEFDIYRRVYGVGAYALYQTMQVVANSDGAGALQVDITVPNDAGYETYSDVPRAYPPP